MGGVSVHSSRILLSSTFPFPSPNTFVATTTFCTTPCCRRPLVCSLAKSPPTLATANVTRPPSHVASTTSQSTSQRHVDGAPEPRLRGIHAIHGLCGRLHAAPPSQQHLQTLPPDFAPCFDAFPAPDRAFWPSSKRPWQIESQLAAPRSCTCPTTDRAFGALPNFPGFQARALALAPRLPLPAKHQRQLTSRHRRQSRIPTFALPNRAIRLGLARTTRPPSFLLFPPRPALP